MGFGIRGLGVGVWGLEFRVWGLEFRRFEMVPCPRTRLSYQHQLPGEGEGWGALRGGGVIEVEGEREDLV